MRKKLSSLRFLSNRVWISVFLQLTLTALFALHAFSMPGVGTDVQITLPVVFSDRELLHHGGIS